MKLREGFTLVEIMIVVAVVGLLAALGILNVAKAMQTSRKKTALTELELLSAGILQLAWDTGRWPNKARREEAASGVNEIWTFVGSGLDKNTIDGIYDGWNGPYYEGSYKDPWGNPYFFDSDYTYEGKSDRIVVGSFGPNGIGRNIYDKDNILVFLDE
jgi:general secretion pathway protein G